MGNADSDRVSPKLSAIMCDGMGWFSEIDYKRVLLIYDEILYLIPKQLVPFKSFGSKRGKLHFAIPEFPTFKPEYFVPDDKQHQIVFEAAKADLANPAFSQIVESIPEGERRYTWSVLNADGDLGRGYSPSLGPGEDAMAHALLLNKFLWAAHHRHCVPVTGKHYIHGLISAKYRFGVEHLRSKSPELLPASLQEGLVKHNPIATRIVSALVSDDELEKRSEADIVKFKERNAKLFERYSYSTRKLIADVKTLPLTTDFDAEVDEIIQTDVWKEKAEIEKELRSAWGSLFKSAVKSTVSGLVGVGITPFLSLGAITLATILTATAALTPWVVSEFISFNEAKNKAQEHGLYYLMKFTR